MPTPHLRAPAPIALTALGSLAALAAGLRAPPPAPAAERRPAPPETPAAFVQHPTRMRGLWIGLGPALVLLAAGAVYAGYEVKASREARASAMALTAGDPDRGPPLLLRYGCAGCHTIPGVPGASGLVGPPLRDIARRVYVGGVVVNTPDNLIAWIVNPRQLSPRTAMPVTGISSAEARQVAAYLYSLR